MYKNKQIVIERVGGGDPDGGFLISWVIDGTHPSCDRLYCATWSEVVKILEENEYLCYS